LSKKKFEETSTHRRKGSRERRKGLPKLGREGL